MSDERITPEYRDRASDALRGSLTHLWYAWASHSSWDEDIDLDVITAAVTFDEDSAPYVTAQLSCAIPDDPRILDALDPRRGVQIAIAAGYGYQDGQEDVQPLALLDLRSRVIRRPGGDMVLEASGHEARLIDAALRGPTNIKSGASAGGTIADLIKRHSPNAVIFDDLPANRRLTYGPDDALFADAGDEVWSFIQELADRADAWVRYDGFQWIIGDVPETLGEPRATLTTGEGGTVTDSEAGLDIEEFYNQVIVRWSDGKSGLAEVRSGPYGVDAIGPKTHVHNFDRDIPGSRQAAVAIARSMVKRGVTRGRRYSLESGGAAYWLRAGDVVEIGLETGPKRRHLISNISFHAYGAMNLQVRTPENSTIQVTTGE